jgi:hypothetical protein
MRIRRALLQTTMLVGLVGATYLSARDAHSQPIFTPNYAAVDGINAKFEGLGGSTANKPLYGARGAVSFPLTHSWGLQIDGAGGSWNSDSFYSIGGHLFWRNPAHGLIGVYVNHLQWNGLDGLHVTQVALEGEYYWNRWTLQGVIGVENGNSNTIIATTPPANVPRSTTVFTQGVTTTTTLGVGARFFDQINLKYYFTDNASGYIGHRYLGGLHAFALGSEVGWPMGGGRMASAFVEGRVGESAAQGVWGGLKMYFGQKDKSLIARHREDDPDHWNIGAANAIAAAVKRAADSIKKFCPKGTSLRTKGSLKGFC